MSPKFNIRIKKIRKQVIEKKTVNLAFQWHTCKNCEYNFEGNYCPSCGQSVTEFQKPVRHFFRDMLDSLLVFDIRVFRSLPTLLLKPGKISDEYVAGKRKRYVPPFRFYLFASIVFFFLISQQTRNLFDPNISQEESKALIDSTFSEMEARGQINKSGDTVLAISDFQEASGMYEFLKNTLRESLRDSTLTDKQRVKRQGQLRSMENPNYLTSQFFKYVSWSFFILMPFYALILRIFFRKKRKYYIEHLVFSVNLHTFYFTLLSIIVLLSMIFENTLKGMAPWILLVALFYALVGIRNFYSKRWVSSFFYTIATFGIYFISSIILIFTVSLVVLGILVN